jgi:hypothetical protein
MMFFGSQTDNTDITIACRVIVYLGILAAILLRYLVLTEVESVIGPGSHVMGRHRRGWDAEEGQRSAERRGQRVRRSVEERTRAASGKGGQVEGLSVPGGAAGERGVVLELDGYTAGAAVVAESRKRVGICIWVGLCQGATMPEDQAPAWNTEMSGECSLGNVLGECGWLTFDVERVS